MDEQTLFERAVVNLGFRSENEFHRLVAKVNLSSNLKLKRFRRWQYKDGTKEGLKRILKMQS